MGQAWAVSYFTDQLMTPCSKYFSGGSTPNGTPGGDRWARVLRGQTDWLSDPLHRVDADCPGSTNLKEQTDGKNEKIRPTENTPRNTHQPSDHDHLETACGETRPTRLPTLVRFQVSRVCRNRSRTALVVGKNDECYTHSDRHTDRLTK